MHLSRLPANSLPPACDCPYPNPWRVIARQPETHVLLRNGSAERLTFVRLSVAVAGALALSLPRHILPGAIVEVVFDRSQPPDPNTLVTLRWFRPNGHEYLWHLSFAGDATG